MGGIPTPKKLSYTRIFRTGAETAPLQLPGRIIVVFSSLFVPLSGSTNREKI